MNSRTVLLLVVVLALVFVLYMSQQPKATSTQIGAANSNALFFGGVGSLFSAVAGAVKSSPSASPSAAPPPVNSTVPVYVTGVGYVQGGANAPIDPSTGGVYLPPGETYGPPAPSSS